MFQGVPYTTWTRSGLNLVWANWNLFPRRNKEWISTFSQWLNNPSFLPYLKHGKLVIFTVGHSTPNYSAEVQLDTQISQIIMKIYSHYMNAEIRKRNKIFVQYQVASELCFCFFKLFEIQRKIVLETRLNLFGLFWLISIFIELGAWKFIYCPKHYEESGDTLMISHN